MESGETRPSGAKLPRACLLESSNNLTNPGLGETGMRCCFKGSVTRCFGMIITIRLAGVVQRYLDSPMGMFPCQLGESKDVGSGPCDRAGWRRADG